MSAADIQKLRRKFIGISMLSIFIVMVFIGLAINFISYTISTRSIKKSLDGLLNLETPKDQSWDTIPSFSAIFSPEYNHNHYFVFTFDGEGTAIKTTDNVGAVDTDEERELVASYVSEAYNGKKLFGRKGNYYYEKKTEDDTTVIAFLNCSTEISIFYRLVILTVSICVIALLITFFLVWRFSGKAVQPEIENNKRQKEFITNAGHELKTPLAVIRANTELIELTGGESEWTQSTLHQVDRMDGLIRNLVLIAKSQEKEKETVIEKIDVSVAVEQTVDTYASVAKQSGKTLSKKIAKDVKLVAEEGKVRQLATILIDNAMKYCDEGGAIEVYLGEDKKGVELTVSNSYASGKDVDYDRFFERFYREDKSHNIDKGGYGIGLSIAENICRQYNGSIKARWENGIIFFTCRLR